jgi:release factor glutamine methyltransferase
MNSQRPAALIKQGITRLTAAGTQSPRAEARHLLAAAADLNPSGLATAGGLDTEVAERYLHLIEQRAAGVPLQHLTGRAWFRKVDVQVGPGVFIPRPETEAVVHFALDQLLNMRVDTGPAPTVVDLGTGSGVIAKSILSEYPGTPQMYAVERSAQALQWARINLANTAATVVAGDMAEALPQLDGRVDLVISNPPYLPTAHADELPADVINFDPHEALFGGTDGLDVIRIIGPVASRLLRPGGWLIVEHDDTQGNGAVEVISAGGDFEHVADHPDLTGRPRFVTAVRRADVGE